MAWGDQGKGPAGGKYLKLAWEQRDKIEKHLSLLRAEQMSRKDAYNLFCGAGNIDGLGPSYFTKLLYFFNRAPDCYIMDQWTGKSINLLTGEHLVRINDKSPTRDNKSGNYQAFCEEIDMLAELLKQDSDLIEQRLMSEEGEEWRMHVKTHYPYNSQRLAGIYPHIPIADF